MKKRQSYQYFTQSNKIDTQNKFYNEIPVENMSVSKISNIKFPTSYPWKVLYNLEDFVIVEPIDVFIDKLIEGKKTV